MPPDLILAYRRYFPLLVHKCARMLGETHEAQDLAQETFLRLHAAELPLTDARAVSAWLYRTSTRLAIDRLRARTRHADTELPDNLADDATPESDLQRVSLWSELSRLVPEDELQAALLTHVDGLGQSEIAEVLGIHERTVRRLLTRFAERAARLRARSER
jgi:RNA polymerase sigma-70 factor (ECF subfamily)